MTPNMNDKKKKGGDLSYAEASAELERILHDIESGDIDLDVLSEKVERAAALIATCRQKLAATEVKVKKVVADLAAAADGDKRGGDGGGSGDDEEDGGR